MSPYTVSTLTAARDLLSRQSFVPDSPAVGTQVGKVNYCAAGILVRVGLERAFSLREALEFEQEMATQPSKDALFAGYRKLGWEAEDCANVIYRNDCAEPATRKMEVDRLFQSLVESSE